MNRITYRQLEKIFTFMKITERIGQLSYDEKHKVGASLIAKDFSNIHSLGYNGNASGLPNLRDSMETGKSGFIHAEQNVLIKSSLKKNEFDDYYLFLTMTPCENCAKLLINSNIKSIIILNHYKNCGRTNEYFNLTGVTIKYVYDYFVEFFSESYLLEDLTQCLKTSNDINFNLHNLMIKHLQDLLVKKPFDILDVDKIIYTDNTKDNILTYTNNLYQIFYKYF